VQNGDAVEHVRIVDEEMPVRMVCAGGEPLSGACAAPKNAPRKDKEECAFFERIYSNRAEFVAPPGPFVEKTLRFARAPFRFRSLFVRLAFF
jgi:hypothetical protein